LAHVADVRATDASRARRALRAPLGLPLAHTMASTEERPECRAVPKARESSPQLSHLGSRGLVA